VNFFFQAEDGIRGFHVTGVQTCALPIYKRLYFLVQLETSNHRPHITLLQTLIDFPPSKKSHNQWWTGIHTRNTPPCHPSRTQVGSCLHSQFLRYGPIGSPLFHRFLLLVYMG